MNPDEKSAAEELAEFEAPEALEAGDAPEAQAETPIEAGDGNAAPEEAPEDEARRLGWRPKEEWKGDTTNWVDAAEYLDRARSHPGTIRKLEERLKRQEDAQARSLRAMQATLERQYKDRLAAAEAKRAEALKSYDAEAVDAAHREIAEIQRDAPRQAPAGPPPELETYERDNEWFRNPLLRGQAKEAIDVALQRGEVRPGDVVGQLAYAEQVMRQAYPHLFAATPRPASPVDGGGRIPRPAKRGRGWDDMPAAERDFALSAVLPQGATAKDREAFAADYWKEYGNG